MSVHAARTGDFGCVVLMDLTRPVVPHIHLDYHLFIALEDGKANFKVGNRRQELSPRKFIAVNPWQPHSYVLDKPDQKVLALVFYFDPLWIASLNSTGPLGVEIILRSSSITDHMLRSAREIATIMMWDVDEVSASKKLNEIVHRLCAEAMHQAVRSSVSDRRKLTARFRTPKDFRLRRSLTYMRENLDNRITLDQVALHAGLSRPRFFHLFKEQSGVTPNMYWDTLRMDAAFRRLSSEETSLSEISFDLGFSSQSNFTRFFTSHFNAPPQHYRSAASHL